RKTMLPWAEEMTERSRPAEGSCIKSISSPELSLSLVETFRKSFTQFDPIRSVTMAPHQQKLRGFSPATVPLSMPTLLTERPKLLEDSIIVNRYYKYNIGIGKLKCISKYTILLTVEVNFIYNRIVIRIIFFNKKNIIVIFPKGEDNIKITAFPQQLAANYINNTASAKIQMSSETPEFSLPGWNTSIEAIGMATDQSRTRSLFYLGDDKVLREAIAIRGKNDWQMAPNRSEKIWPLADDPSAGLAVAYHQGQGMTWIYYWSNETIVQAHKNHDGEWEKAIALPQTVPKNETKSDGPTDDFEPVSEDTGLTTGAKAGVGVGVAAGVIALGALIWFFMKKRRNTQTPPQKEDVAVAEAGGNPVTVPAPMYEKDTYKTGDATTPAEMSGDGRPVEIDNQTSFVYELPGNDRR
ncbi:hypothetical protein LB507_004181, partial [Fusarium sp. FIESC RH6]